MVSINPLFLSSHELRYGSSVFLMLSEVSRNEQWQVFLSQDSKQPTPFKTRHLTKFPDCHNCATTKLLSMSL
jgi:hypothetical protein